MEQNKDLGSRPFYNVAYHKGGIKDNCEMEGLFNKNE